MPSCTGNGADGTHCCFIGGQVCEFLNTSGPIPRCSLLVELGTWAKVHRNKDYKRSPVAAWFTERFPGQNVGCGDWPQNIPEVMEASTEAGPFYACCWGTGNG